MRAWCFHGFERPNVTVTRWTSGSVTWFVVMQGRFLSLAFIDSWCCHLYPLWMHQSKGYVQSFFECNTHVRYVRVPSGFHETRPEQTDDKYQTWKQPIKWIKVILMVRNASSGFWVPLESRWKTSTQPLSGLCCAWGGRPGPSVCWCYREYSNECNIIKANCVVAFRTCLC